ncbi:MAG: aminotransferase class IV [Bacteroidota bacterium]
MSQFYYIDGSIVAKSEATIPVSDLGLQRGFGVFDFMRTYNGSLFHPMDHWARFQRSASELHLDLPVPYNEILEIGKDLLDRSRLDYPALKLILTGGDGTPSSPYDQPRLIIMAENYPVYPDRLYRQGAKLITVEYQRELPQVKSLNYMNTLRLERFKNRYRAYDLLYHHSDYGVTESPRANLFMVTDDVLYTPSDHILKGITRNIILNLAEDVTKIQERPLSLSEVREADELFLTSTSKRIIPVTQLDDQIIGNGEPGPLTRMLMGRFDKYTAAYS